VKVDFTTRFAEGQEARSHPVGGRIRRARLPSLHAGLCAPCPPAKRVVNKLFLLGAQDRMKKQEKKKGYLNVLKKNQPVIFQYFQTGQITPLSFREMPI